MKHNRHSGCVKCASTHIICIDSRHDSMWRMRRRRCLECNHRWNTYEVPAELVEGMEVFLIQAQRMRDTATSMATLLEMFGVRLNTPACPDNNTGGAPQPTTPVHTTNS